MKHASFGGQNVHAVAAHGRAPRYACATQLVRCVADGRGEDENSIVSKKGKNGDMSCDSGEKMVPPASARKMTFRFAVAGPLSLAVPAFLMGGGDGGNFYGGGGDGGDGGDGGNGPQEICTIADDGDSVEGECLWG